MKKVKVFLMAMLASVSISLVSCNSCSNGNNEVETINSLNFDSIVRSDYEEMCGNVNDCNVQSSEATVFYEAQVWFDTTLNTDEFMSRIVKIVTVFQYKDTCTRIFHTLVNGEVKDSIEKINDFWLEDCTTVPYNKVSLDSAIHIGRNAGIMPSTDFVVMRRPLFPPFPTENYYIFGNISNSICIDAEDGHIVNEY